MIVQLAAIAAIAATATFTNTFTTGGAIIAMLIVIVTGIFTLRSKMSTVWRDLYEAANAKNDQLIEQIEEERVLRHGIKDDLAATKLLLEAERNKPDLSAILDQQRTLWTEATRNLTTLITGLLATQGKMQETQLEILTLLHEARAGGTPLV